MLLLCVNRTGESYLDRDDELRESASASARPRRIIATNTTLHTATPTQTQTSAKSVIARVPATAPTTKLQAAYMPTANTVDQRLTL